MHTHHLLCTQGWNEDESMTYDFKDGTSLYCDERCSSASDPVYEPVIFDPATRKL